MNYSFDIYNNDNKFTNVRPFKHKNIGKIIKLEDLVINPIQKKMGFKGITMKKKNNDLSDISKGEQIMPENTESERTAKLPKYKMKPLEIKTEMPHLNDHTA